MRELSHVSWVGGRRSSCGAEYSNCLHFHSLFLHCVMKSFKEAGFSFRSCRCDTLTVAFHQQSSTLLGVQMALLAHRQSVKCHDGWASYGLIDCARTECTLKRHDGGRVRVGTICSRTKYHTCRQLNNNADSSV